MPRWRAPVYRTPFGIILVAKLFKLLGWLVPDDRPASAGRQRARPGPPRRGSSSAGSPLAALVLAVVRHADRLAVVLGRSRSPGGSAARPGQVAHLVLTVRRWAAVMTIAGVAAVVSGPDPAARPRQGHPPPDTQIGYMSGWSRASPRPTSPSARRTWRTGSAPCYAGSAPPGPGRWCWRFIRRDALAALVPALPIPEPPRSQGAAGRPPRRRAALAGQTPRDARADRGATGAGKASLLWGLVRAMFPAYARRPGPGPWPLIPS